MLCLLSALLLCVWCIVLEICLYSHFKGVLEGFWGCYVGLCWVGALRGLWGFCTRVELGGLKACGVFAPLLPLFCPLSCPFAPAFLACPLVLLSSLPALFVLVSLWFLFPLRMNKQKERAQRFCPLCPLFVCCGLV